MWESSEGKGREGEEKGGAGTAHTSIFSPSLLSWMSFIAFSTRFL